MRTNVVLKDRLGATLDSQKWKCDRSTPSPFRGDGKSPRPVHSSSPKAEWKSRSTPERPGRLEVWEGSTVCVEFFAPPLRKTERTVNKHLKTSDPNHVQGFTHVAESAQSQPFGHGNVCVRNSAPTNLRENSGPPPKGLTKKK